jgi:hypothetical protein
VKKTATQFNCQKGDTVVVVRRKRGRSLRETLTIVSIGIANEHGHPLDFMAADKKGKAFKLSPFEDSDALRVVILPKEVPAELARYKGHPKFVVARMPGCDRFTYRLVSRKNLEPVCRIRVERQMQEILVMYAFRGARDEEVVSATEFFIACGKRITLKGLIVES